MGKTEIDGDQVQDESLTGDDVQDGSLLKVDLSGAVQAEINANTAKVSDINHVQIELPNVDNTSDVDKPVSTAQAAADTAVQNYSIQRANHTGTQLSSTISDFASTVRSTLLTGISFANSALVTASDSILIAVGKLQAQLNNMLFGRDADENVVINNDTTTGNAWKDYATMIFNVSDTSGINKYRINNDFLWGHNSASNDIRVRVELDGNVIKEIRIEPKDQGTDQRIQNNLLIYAEDLAQGSHTVILSYRPASSSRVSRMYRCEQEVWRTK